MNIYTIAGLNNGDRFFCCLINKWIIHAAKISILPEQRIDYCFVSG
jgi:hypothetical protein